MAKTESLYNFMNALNKNSVRSQNLFEMHVFIPNALSSHGIYDEQDLKYLNPNFTYYGQGFTLPTRTIQYQDVGFKGFKVPVPTVLQMTQEHDVTINADIEGNMRRAFLTWQALIINPRIADNGGYFEGNRTLGYGKEGAVSKIIVDLLDPTYQDKHKIIETYTIYGVTVEDVGTMTLSNVDSNLATFQVKFKSQYWQYGIPSDGSFTRAQSGGLLFNSIY